MSSVVAPRELQRGWVVGGGSLRTRGRVSWQTFPWRRASIVALLALATILYVWDLGASGWGNSFYAAAVQAATKSWKAFLFGSFDSSNFITVDKPPASLWVMDVSARIFGINSWSILLPQALEGVAAVGLLYATVRRRFGHAAGLLAGLVLAVTPVAALIFRYNNPDALLVLLLVASAFAMERALEHGRTRWLVLAAVLIGFGFLTKMLQAFVVVPVFAGVYALAAPVSLRTRLMQLLAAAGALVVSAGWWVALVLLWPASSRPYIGGSSDNSILNLIFGYNGFGRITGNETGSVGGGGPGGWGPTGITRMFNASFGGDISWLIPAALIGFAAVLWLRWRAPRTDLQRASALLWGGWLILTALLFSFAQGIIHPYYTIALAPAIGALVGAGGVALWRERHRLSARSVLAAMVVAATVWSAVLLSRSPDWLPWLRYAVIAGGLLAAAGLIAAGTLRRVATAAVIGLAIAAALGGSVAYAVDTALTPHTGAIPTAGPAVAAAGGFGPGGGPRGGLRFGPGTATGAPPAGPGTATGAPPPGAGQFVGGPPGFFGPGPSTSSPFGRGGFGPGGGGAPLGQGRGGAGGGLLNASTPSSGVVAALQHNASSYTWVAATVGANSAAGYQLATDDAVMAVGGFNGTDPTPTLSQFEQYVSKHEIHYFIAGGGGGLGPGRSSSSSSAIATWVQQHFTSTSIGGVTLYDLTAPLPAGTSSNAG